MRIAIFGSYFTDNKKYPMRGSQEEFITACRGIGREIAHGHHVVLTTGDAQATADLHIIDGILEVTEGTHINQPLVEVIRRSDTDPAFEVYAQKHPNLFSFHSRTKGWWEGAQLILVKEADTVLTLAGGKGTYISGLAGIIANKRVIPIGCFGGASAKLVTAIEKIGNSSCINEIRQLNGPWTPHSLDLIRHLFRTTTPPKLLIIHGRNDDWLKLKDWLHHQAAIPEVLVMQQQPGGGRTLPEKFESLASEVDAAIALATPDDMGALKARGAKQFEPRARQNVWLEIGWFWGRRGRSHVMILCKGSVEIPSDLYGLEIYFYKNTPTERADEIRAFITGIHSSDRRRT